MAFSIYFGCCTNNSAKIRASIKFHMRWCINYGFMIIDKKYILFGVSISYVSCDLIKLSWLIEYSMFIKCFLYEFEWKLIRSRGFGVKLEVKKHERRLKAARPRLVHQGRCGRARGSILHSKQQISGHRTRQRATKRKEAPGSSSTLHATRHPRRGANDSCPKSD